MKRVLLLLSVVLLLAQPALAKTKLRCSKLVAGSDGKSKVATFSATKVLDVDLLVQFTPGHAKALADEDHWVEVRFFGPQGFVYESRMVPLTADPRQVSDFKQFPGYARPLPRKLVKTSKSGNELEVSVPLPVAATSIVESSLYGTWRAEAYLDDSTEPCTDALTFVITQ